MPWTRKALFCTAAFVGLLVAAVVFQENRIERLAKSHDQENAWSYKLGQTSVRAFFFGNLAIWGFCWSTRQPK